MLFGDWTGAYLLGGCSWGHELAKTLEKKLHRIVLPLSELASQAYRSNSSSASRSPVPWRRRESSPSGIEIEGLVVVNL